MHASPAELLKRHNIDFVATKAGKFTTNCPNCFGGYLNVKTEKDRIVWYCHNCDQGGSEQFEQREAGNELGPITAIYEYTDEFDKRLFQVLRFEPINQPKQFRQRVGPDQERWSIKGIRRVPYRLRELIEDIANDHIVFIVEGEKDVITLREHGVPATCNPMGAGKDKWRAEFGEIFKDADVVVCCDNDQPGRDHVADIAVKLSSVAKRVRVLDLAQFWPDIEISNDISDWFKAGGTVERLWDMVDQLEDWQPRFTNGNGADDWSHDQKETPNKAPQLLFINMSKWDDEPLPEQSWSVPNRIPLAQSVLFSGEGSAGKSTVQLHLSVAHVLGRDWLGTMPQQGCALFIDAEDDEKVIHRRLGAVTKHYNVKFNDLIKGGLHLMSLAGKDAVLACATRGGKIEPSALYHQVLEAVGDIKPVMIGFASSANFYAGSEIDRSQVQQFISLLTRLAILANGSVVLISHPSLTGIATDTGLSGNTQWHNSVRARYFIKGVKPDEGQDLNSNLREIVFKKSNYSALSENIVLEYRDGLFLPLAGVSSLDQVAQNAMADHLFLELLKRFKIENRFVGDKRGPNYAPAQFAKEDEAQRIHVSSKAFEASMIRLFREQKIRNEPSPGRKDRFRIMEA